MVSRAGFFCAFFLSVFSGVTLGSPGDCPWDLLFRLNSAGPAGFDVQQQKEVQHYLATLGRPEAEAVWNLAERIEVATNTENAQGRRPLWKEAQELSALVQQDFPTLPEDEGKADRNEHIRNKAILTAVFCPLSTIVDTGAPLDLRRDAVRAFSDILSAVAPRYLLIEEYGHHHGGLSYDIDSELLNPIGGLAKLAEEHRADTTNPILAEVATALTPYLRTLCSGGRQYLMMWRNSLRPLAEDSTLSENARSAIGETLRVISPSTEGR